MNNVDLNYTGPLTVFLQYVGKIFREVQQLEKNIFSSLLYCKTTVFNTYAKYVLIHYVISKTSGQTVGY